MENTNIESKREIYATYAKESFAEVDSTVVDKLCKSADGKMAFSWCTAIIGIIYFFYRKCYLEGIIVMLIASIITEFVPYVGTPLGLIFSGFMFFPLYRRRIERLHKAGKDPAKYGGTSIIAVGIAIAIMIVIIVGLVLLMDHGLL